jgi:chromosome segregation ATPase
MFAQSGHPYTTFSVNELRNDRTWCAVEQREQELQVKVSERDTEIARLKAELAQLKPELLDLTADDSHGEAEEDTQRTRVNRSTLTAALHTRLADVKKEKRAAEEDVEDQQETTQQTALMLDRWQSYADVLKNHLQQVGERPLSWGEFGESMRQ